MKYLSMRLFPNTFQWSKRIYNSIQVYYKYYGKIKINQMVMQMGYAINQSSYFL